MAENYDYANQYYSDITLRIRDLEEKQRALKDRLLLVGENLLELKDKTTEELIEIKKNMQIMNSTLEKLKNFVESASDELSKFARKEDLEILSKQAKMFQPLEFVRFSDLEKLKKK